MSGDTAGLGQDEIDALSTVDDLVAALAQQPVLVQTVLGEGDTAGVSARLREAVQEVDVPSYVLLVQTPSDVTGDRPSSELIVLLERRGAPDGLYVVATTDDIVDIETVGVQIGPPEVSLYLAYADARDTVEESYPRTDSGFSPLMSDAGAAEVALATAAAADPDDESGFSPDPEVLAEIGALSTTYDPRDFDVPSSAPPDLSGALVLAVATGLLSAFLVARAGTWWPARARREPRTGPAAPPTASELAAVRSEAQQRVQELAAELVRLPVDPPDRPAMESAIAAREAAEQMLRGDGLPDVVGALVLARTGQADVRRARGRRTRAYRCCFFHPLHGASTTTRSWNQHGGAVEVPVCGGCSRDLRDNRSPESFTPGRFGRDRPYYELDTVWADTGYGSLVDDFAVQVLTDRARRR